MNRMGKDYQRFTDQQGNILSVVDENGGRVFDATYDAWGRQTVTLNTICLHRGYTGHEMMGEFGLINMNRRSLARSGESNGRVYDPTLGRFLSPDNYVQAPGNSQSFNRYSYCLNNPLKYTDPSGELFGIDDLGIALAFAGLSAANSMIGAAYSGKSVWKAGVFSLLGSAATYGVGAVFGQTGSFGNELLRAGAHGLENGILSLVEGGKFGSAFLSGASSSCIGSYTQVVNLHTGLMVASTTAMSGVTAWVTGGDFIEGAIRGMTIGILNHRDHDPANRGQLFHGKNARERAYQYMKRRSEKMNYELSAAYLDNGDVLVFREKGNTMTSSRNYYSRKGDNTTVSINGREMVARGSVHTHPYVAGIKDIDNPLSVSKADIKLSVSFFDSMLDILVVKTANGIECGVYRINTNGNGLAYPGNPIFKF